MKVIRTSRVYNHHTFSTSVDAIVVNPVRINIFALAYLHNHNIDIYQIAYPYTEVPKFTLRLKWHACLQLDNVVCIISKIAVCEMHFIQSQNAILVLH